MDLEMTVDPTTIKAMRDAKGWSQELLATAAGISVRTLQRVEAEGHASRETLNCLAAALDCRVADFAKPPAAPTAGKLSAAMNHLPSDAPGYVRYGLLGLYSRRAALGFLWLSLSLGVVSLLAGLWLPWLLPGGVFLFAALWYWAAIHWVDHRAQWPAAATGEAQS